MHDIHRLLRSAAWRLGLNNFVFGLIWALALALVGCMVLRVLQQTMALDVAWKQIAIWGSAGVVVSAAIYAVAFRPNRKAVALKVDEGANLREAISTALYAVGNEDAWSRATVESAAQTARRVEVKRAVPFNAPRAWPLPLALALAFAVLYIALPQMTLFDGVKDAAAEKARTIEAVKVTTQVQDMKQKLDQMTQKLGIEKMDGPPDTNKPGPVDPDAIRRSAMKQLTKLSDQLEQIKQSESAMKLEAMRKAMQEIKPTGEKTSELAKAMKSGDFKQAKQELENLQNKMQSGEMNAQDREDLAEQMSKLADQLTKLAENKEDLAKKLEEAGLDKNLANNTEALKKALEAAKNLTQEQKEELLKQAQANEQASEALNKMAEALNQMCEQCKNPGNSGAKGSKPSNNGSKNESSEGQSGQQGEQGSQSAADEMGEQLSQMEQVSQEMEMAEAAMGECENQMNAMGEGQCSGEKMGDGMSYSSGGGKGGTRAGSGKGNGRGTGEPAADYDLAKKKDNKRQSNKGPIVASRLVEGESVLNESTAAFETAVAVAEGEVSEEISTNTIPRDRHDAIKNYFGRLKQRADDAARKAAPAGSTSQPAAKPAKDAE